LHAAYQSAGESAPKQYSFNGGERAANNAIAEFCESIKWCIQLQLAWLFFNELIH